MGLRPFFPAKRYGMPKQLGELDIYWFYVKKIWLLQYCWAQCWQVTVVGVILQKSIASLFTCPTPVPIPGLSLQLLDADSNTAKIEHASSKAEEQNEEPINATGNDALIWLRCKTSALQVSSLILKGENTSLSKQPNLYRCFVAEQWYHCHQF